MLIKSIPEQAMRSPFGNMFSTTESGISINHENALYDSTVMACIRVISKTISNLPLKLYAKKGKQWVEDTNSLQYETLCRKPNARQTTGEMVEQIVAQMLLNSESYALIQKTPKGKILGIIPFNSPKQVSVTEVGNNLRYDVVTNDHKSRTVSPDEILHLRDLSLNTYRSIDKIHYGKESLGLAIAATKNAANYYSKGPRAGGFIVADGKLSDEAFSRLSQQVNDSYTGNDNAHRLAVLENGMKYQSNDYSLANSQTLVARENSIREIAQIFGVPVEMLGITTSASTKTNEMLHREFYTGCLQNIIQKIEDRINLALTRDCKVIFNTNEYLRGDVKTRAEISQKLFSMGLIDSWEARDMLDKQPYGDKPVMVVASNNLVFGDYDDMTNPEFQRQATQKQPEPEQPKEVENEETSTE